MLARFSTSHDDKDKKGIKIYLFIKGILLNQISDIQEEIQNKYSGIKTNFGVQVFWFFDKESIFKSNLMVNCWNTAQVLFINYGHLYHLKPYDSQIRESKLN